MKKAIVKSITITLILILLFTTIFSVVLCVFFPQTVSNLSFKVGNYDTAVTYSEKAYQKNQTAEYLVDLVEKSIVAKNYTITSTYAGLLLASEDFRNNVLPNKQSGYLNYLATSYVKSLYFICDYQKCIKNAINYTDFEEKGINPTTTLITISAENNNKTVLNLLLNELDLLESNEIIEEYIFNINTILQN